MKMADSEKTEDFLDADSLPECPPPPVHADSATASSVNKGGEQQEQDSSLKTETTPTTSSPPREEKEGGGDPESPDPGLLSMPCLMKELHRDSPESQHGGGGGGGASTGSDTRPASGRHVYESDSSNACMVSPSSSGHLADSDTLSSGEERSVPQGGGEATNMEAGGADPGQAPQTSAAVTAGGRKSRRSRSESETPSSAMAAKKNRCQPSSSVAAAAAAAAGAAGALGQEKQTNGKLAKVKGHRSQKHKERMRLLRQKREAAARKKYNLLQDSSTSDSELTCDSSTSSSDDDDDGTSGGGGGSKTINTDIPAGFRRATERSRVGAQIHGLLDSSGSWDRNSIGSVLEEAMTRFAVMQRQTEERFRVWMEKLTRLDSDDDDSSKHSSDALEGGRRRRGRRGNRPSPPSSFLPSSESAETMAAYMLTRENMNLTPSSAPIMNNNNTLPEVVTPNGNLVGVPDPGVLNV